jgi:hypothetical protein
MKDSELNLTSLIRRYIQGLNDNYIDLRFCHQNVSLSV